LFPSLPEIIWKEKALTNYDMSRQGCYYDIVMVMTCSMGKGCAFSAVPVFLWEGGLTLLVSVIRPVMTDLAMGYP
jgi:hypothetical protein